MINIKKITYLLSIAAIAVDGAWGLEVAAHFYPKGPKSAGGVEKRLQSGYCRLWEHCSEFSRNSG